MHREMAEGGIVKFSPIEVVSTVGCQDMGIVFAHSVMLSTG